MSNGIGFSVPMNRLLQPIENFDRPEIGSNRHKDVQVDETIPTGETTGNKKAKRCKEKLYTRQSRNPQDCIKELLLITDRISFLLEESELYQKN